jgi:predicted exporter
MPQLTREAAEVRALFGDTRERTVFITRGENIAAARDNLDKFLAWHAGQFPDAATATLGEAIPLRADHDALPARLGELHDFAPQLRAALERHGFEAAEFEPFFAAWSSLLASPRPDYNTTVRRLAGSLHGQTALLMSTTPGASWFITVAAHPAGEEPPAKFGTVSLNQVESLNKIFTRYRLSALHLSVIGLVLVGLSMWLIYGVKRGSLIFATPVGSCLFAFGVLGLLGVTLNLFHLLGAFLGVCLSHNYSIFNAENEIRREQPPPSIRLSALCTAASFGVLACSGIPVVSALGVTVMLIVVTALVVVELRRVAKRGEIPNPEIPNPK